MQVPEKNIKGLSLLELVVVLVLIGVVTAVAYPDFTEWNRERKVRNGTDRVLSFMKNIHAQTERGTFAYVQVLINNNNNRLQLTSKGMTMQDLTDKIHDGESDWNAEATSRCEPEATDYWSSDTAGEDADIKNYVFSIDLKDVTTSFNGTTAICFARNGKFFEADGDVEIEDSSVPYQFILICQRDSRNSFCPVEYQDLTDTKPDLPVPSNTEFLRTINWTRFGEFSVNTFKKCYNDEDFHIGGYWDDDDEDVKNEKCPI